MEERTCLHCGQPFQVPYPSSKRQNCSEKCRIARLRQPGRKKRADTGARKSQWVTVRCAECESPFEVPPWKARQDRDTLYCSRSCSAARRERRYREGPQRGQRPIGRPAGRALRGPGRHVTRDGYVMIYVAPEERPPDQVGVTYHPEHRVVMSKILGRWPTRRETVHHLNGDKADNRPANLQLRHGSHGRGAIARCRCCGSSDIEYVELE